MGKQKYEWSKLKNEFLMGKITLKDLAIKHDIPEQVLWNKAHKEEWTKELEETQKKKDAELSKQLQMDIIQIDKGELLEEYRVRVESFQTAHDVQSKLLNHLETLVEGGLKKLSPADTIKGILACSKVKTEAAGLPDKFEMKLPSPAPSHDPYVSTVEDAIEDHQRAMKLLDQLIVFSKANEEKKAMGLISGNSKGKLGK